MIVSEEKKYCMVVRKSIRSIWVEENGTKTSLIRHLFMRQWIRKGKFCVIGNGGSV